MSRLIPREEWGARFGLGWYERPLPAATCWLHHSVTNAPGPNATLAEDIAHMQYLDWIGYQRFGPHTGTWWDPARKIGAGISYTVVVMRSGRRFQGHDIRRSSSHTSGHNTDGMAACLAGDYTHTEPTAAALESLALTVAEFHRDGHLVRARFDGGHRDTGFPTACPGDRLYAHLPWLNQRAAVLAGGDPPYVPPTTWPPGHIARIQTMLNRLGYRLAVDDSHGPDTQAAVASYQAARDLLVDGSPGPVTTAALEADMATLEEILAAVQRLPRDISAHEVDNRTRKSKTRLDTLWRLGATHAQVAALEAKMDAALAVGGVDSDALGAAIADALREDVVEAIAGAGSGASAEEIVDLFAARLSGGEDD